MLLDLRPTFSYSCRCAAEDGVEMSATLQLTRNGESQFRSRQTEGHDMREEAV